MTDSTGKTGRGVTLDISDGTSPAVFVAIANATTISNTGRDAEQIDFTHLQSSGGFREFRQGFKDPGQIGFEYHFTPTEASHVSLLALWVAGTVIDFQINFVGAGWNYYLRGQGFVMNPGDITVNVNDPIRGAGTLRVTGQMTFVGA